MGSKGRGVAERSAALMTEDMAVSASDSGDMG